MTKNRLKLGLGVLTVLATPIAVNAVASSDVHAEYRGSIYYYNNKPANWWYSDGNDWYFFQNGKKLTGYGQDNAGVHYFVNGKYANGKVGNKEYRDGKEVSVENKVPTRGYANGVYYVNSKPANWWYSDGSDWYFFQNGKKLTGYGQDNAGAHYFVNGKYANGKVGNKEYRDGKEVSVENKVPTRGYANGVYYVNSKPANWWYSDGNDWYFFQNGKKLTGTGQDNAGAHYFVNGKYANGKIGNKEYRDGKEVSVENKVPTRGYANGVYYVDSKPANWWYDDGKDWYFFQNGKKLTGTGKDSAGVHYFVDGKYANGKVGNKEYRDGKEVSVENNLPARGYINGIYYVDNKPANWWYDDGKDWYFFQNGKKLTGYGKDNAGTHYFYNGKYSSDKNSDIVVNKPILNDELGWQKRNGGNWYYYEQDGSLARNKWIGGTYWVDSEGKMAKSTWVDNGRYYVDSSGKLAKNYLPVNKNTAALNMPQYYQGDYRWANRRYGIGTMAQSGCVPTSLAMVFNGLGQKVLPTAVADTIYNNTNEMNVGGLGTSGKGAVYAINAYGYKHTVITTREQLIAALQSGKPVFATVGNGIFAKGRLTHAIILSGYSNGKTKAMDPDSAYNTGKWYDINTIWNQRSTDPYDTNIGGSFVAIG